MDDFGVAASPVTGLASITYSDDQYADNVGSANSGECAPADNNPNDATQLDRCQVTVTLPFSDVRWSVVGLATGPGTMLSAQSVWGSIKDLAYPAVDYPPAE